MWVGRSVLDVPKRRMGGKSGEEGEGGGEGGREKGASLAIISPMDGIDGVFAVVGWVGGWVGGWMDCLMNELMNLLKKERLEWVGGWVDGFTLPVFLDIAAGFDDDFPLLVKGGETDTNAYEVKR